MQAWENFLKRQEEELGAETTNRWLRSLKVLHFDACNLYLEAQDSIHAVWFEEHIRPNLKKKLLNNNHHQIKVHLALAEENASQNVPKGTKKGKKQIPSSIQVFAFDEIEKRANFKNFVPSINQIPYQLFCEMTGFDHKAQKLESPKMSMATFNPIYLCGGPGSGKTHLLMAAAQAFKEKGLNALYIRAETFTEHVVSAIRGGAMQEFRKAYRHADVLLMDDVHIFARRNATQEEFFHTFNTLHTSGRQIILSASTLPQHLQEIEPRLISRFEWGLTLHLEKLPVQDLKTVLQQRSRDLNFTLSDELCQFLMKAFYNNPKSLHRALEALLLRQHLDSQIKRTASISIDVASAEKTLADLIEEEKRGALNPEKIVKAVADFYGIRVDDILGKAQSHDCALPRQIAMHLCRSELNMPFIKIGTYFSRDHSTVMSSVKQIDKKIDAQDKEIGASLSNIKRQMEAQN